MHMPIKKTFEGLDHTHLDFYKSSADYIKSCQSPSGAIPSLKGGKLDPWDHIESIMGLVTLGHLEAARLGFDWLVNNQNKDGSWHSEFVDDKAIQTNKQTHFSCYMSTGLLHYYLITKDLKYVKSMWPYASKGINFSIDLQNDKGTIPWCLNEEGLSGDDFLVTGSSSILKSLECAIALFNITQDADELKLKNWQSSYLKLKKAIRNPEGLFDIKIDRKRFSMDWYYPIISGAFNRDESKDIIVNTLADFYIEGLGIKCVKEEPWVMVAETNEFVIAAVKADEINLAKNIFLESLNISDEHNIPYMGWQYVENIFWPDEKPSWTAAAVILAADSLYKFTDGCNLFIDIQTKNL